MRRAWEQGEGVGELQQSGMDKHLLLCMCVRMCVSLGGLHLCLFVTTSACVFSWFMWISFRRTCTRFSSCSEVDSSL